MLRTGAKDPAAALSGSTPYLRMFGVTLGGWLLARTALAAATTADAELAQSEFVQARFYAEQILPQVGGLLPAATAGSRDLFALPSDRLAGATARR